MAPHVSSLLLLVEAVEAGQMQEARPPALEAEDEADPDPEARVRFVKSEEDKDQEEDRTDQIEEIVTLYQVGVVRHVLQDNRANIASVVVNHPTDMPPVVNLQCIIQSFVRSARLSIHPSRVFIIPGLFVLTTRMEAAIIAAPEPGAQHPGLHMDLTRRADIGQEILFTLIKNQKTRISS